MRFAGNSGKVKFVVICGGKPVALGVLWGSQENRLTGSRAGRSLGSGA